MKKLITIVLAVGTLTSARAQLFSPEAFSGAAFGAVIGGVVGGDTHWHHHHSHRSFSGEGAAIGAGIGLLAGVLAGEARRDYYASPGCYAPAPAVGLGYGYTRGGSSTYVYYAPNAYCAPGYYYRPPRPNYALGGTLLGAASGTLIGAGDHHAGEGAAIGAAAGLVLGSIAEGAAKQHERTVVAAAQPVPVPSPASPNVLEMQPASPPQVTSQPCADSTYYWTPRPQIPDAPRVPDAPTF